MTKAKRWWQMQMSRGTALALLFALSQSAMAADEVLEKAASMLESGESAAVYQTLEPLEAERAGDPEFDLLLGIAALDVGQNTRGVFALERVLAVQPGNTRARAEIGRAYLALGETDAARQELKTVREQEIPDPVARTIDRYLDAVDRLDYTVRTTVRGYLDVTMGHDSNVNAGPNQGTVAIPGFGNLPFTLSKDSQANADNFTQVGGGVSVRHPLTRELALTAGASGWTRMNNNQTQFDTANRDFNVGLVYSKERHTLSLTAQQNRFWVDDEDYRLATGMTGQWQYNLNSHNQVMAFLQYSDLEYDKQSIRDADRWMYGVGLAHALRTGTVLFGSVYGVNEKEKASNVSHLGYDGYGLRFGGQTSANEPWVFFASASMEQRRYGGEDRAFLKTRKDTQYDLSAGATYYFNREWSVTPRVSYTKNDSNVELNEYNRNVFSVTLRRDF